MSLPLINDRLFLLLAALLLATASPTTAEPVKIAAIFAFSGKAAQTNKPAILGTELAVDEINREGGVMGQQVELLFLDNDSSPIGSHLAAERAAAAGVTAIIGSVWSSHSLAIAKVAEKNRIPMIATNSTTPSLTAIGDHIFRVCYDDNFQGGMLARFAFEELKARTALVFVDIASDFSFNLADIFSRNFRLLGGKIVREIEYKSGNSVYVSQVQEALASDADIVFLSGHDESGRIAEKLQDAGSKAIPIGSDGWDDAAFYISGGNKIKQGYHLSQWWANHQDPRSGAFLEKYRHRGEIVAATALAYDAVQILIAAIKKAGATDSAAIRGALHSLKGFQGLTGEINFDAQGNARKPAYMMEIRHGVPSPYKYRLSQ